MRRSTQLLSGLFCLGLVGLAQPAQSRVMLEVDPFMEPQMGFVNTGPFLVRKADSRSTRLMTPAGIV